MVLVKGSPGRAFRSSRGFRARGRNGLRRSPLPDALEDGLVEIVHHEGSLALKTAASVGMVGPDEEAIPLALLQQPRRDLVPVVSRDSILILRGKRATPSHRHSIHKDFVGPGESAQVQSHRFGEEVPLVRREETVMGLEPGPVPAPRRGRRGGIGRDRPRDGYRLPRIRCIDGRSGARTCRQDQPNGQEQRQHTGHDGGNPASQPAGTAAQKHIVDREWIVGSGMSASGQQQNLKADGMECVARLAEVRIDHRPGRRIPFAIMPGGAEPPLELDGTPDAGLDRDQRAGSEDRSRPSASRTWASDGSSAAAFSNNGRASE